MTRVFPEKVRHRGWFCCDACTLGLFNLPRWQAWQRIRGREQRLAGRTQRYCRTEQQELGAGAYALPTHRMPGLLPSI